MGSGKTHWGKLWAKEHGMDFWDLDAMIEEKEQKAVDALFSEFGESYFREAESIVLRTFTGKDNYILASGGGTPCFHNNMQWMNDNGTTVYLRATADQIIERVKNEKHKRPLLKQLNDDEILPFVSQKIKERELFYSHAKIILPAGGLTIASFNEIQKFEM